MRFLRLITSPAFFLNVSVFAVTQLMGLLLSLGVCFILRDFTWAFVRIALINSLILGLSLIGSCRFTQAMMFRMRGVSIVAVSFSLILGVGIISMILLLYVEPTLFIYYARGAFSFLVVNFLFIIALYMISSGLIIYQEIVLEKERTIANERNLKNRMEMKLLLSKVNPHFLFNTLNTILFLLKQPEKAEAAILDLSDLLRRNLEQSEKSSVDIGEELENVRQYLALQKLRFDKKLDFIVSVDASFAVPPLIVQPLVENSIKHTIRNVEYLTIEITAHRAGKDAVVRIFDSGRRVEPSMLDKGQGLTITKKRVENAGGEFRFVQGGIELWFRR